MRATTCSVRELESPISCRFPVVVTQQSSKPLAALHLTLPIRTEVRLVDRVPPSLVAPLPVVVFAELVDRPPPRALPPRHGVKRPFHATRLPLRNPHGHGFIAATDMNRQRIAPGKSRAQEHPPSPNVRQPPFSPSPISTTTSAGTQLKKQIPSNRQRCEH